MALAVERVTIDRLDDVAELFCADRMTNGCWCMWFIVPVKAFHAAGSAGNRAAFGDLLATSEEPLGLLAYEDGCPVGWCAAGPRSRYARAIKTPTYRGGPPESDSDIWLVPCFFVHGRARSRGITRALLDAAVDLAREFRATAIEGFPLTGSDKRKSADLQVGFQSVFSACGFEVVRAPSSARVVMRRELTGEASG